MTLSTALNSALSGLTAASRSIGVVSANVANAMTPGFARREIHLASNTVGGNGAGVTVAGVTRVVNERALADQRDANASTSNAAARADAWLAIETAIGYPTEDGSLSDRIDRFEAALISATSRPEETVRLRDAVTAAGSVADTINEVSDGIQQMRMDADAEIASLVERVNGQLDQVQTLNWQIFRMGNQDQDVAALMDERQHIVDSLSEIIPVRQVERTGNQIAIFTPGGATLIDGPAAELSFSPTATITADMVVENGVLSGLELNGQPLAMNSAFGSVEGGMLSAAFDVRDRIATEAQAGLDALARSLIERFEDASLDPTIVAGSPGLFTDSGNALDLTDPDDEIGLAGRISVNANVNPSLGGAVWRIRDGVGAAAPGEVGNSSLLSAMADRIAESLAPASGPSAGVARSVSGLASDFLSAVDARFRFHEDAQAFHSARSDALAHEIAADGVDTDDEMQKLLLIEQVYAANARVIQTVDELIQNLLEI